jgi:hypothetical protein
MANRNNLDHWYKRIVEHKSPGQIRQEKKQSKVNQAIEQSQCLINAVWQRKVDQMTTGSVAQAYGLSQNQALRLLKKIASGKSGDARFVYVSDRRGVKISDGTIFTYSRMSIDGRYGSREHEPTHYVWFCS